MRRYYPNLVEQYEESIKKPPKEKKTRSRKKKEEPKDQSDKPKRKYNRKPKKLQDIAMSNLNESLKNMSLSKQSDLNSSKLQVSVCVNKLKRKLKSNVKGKANTIENYLRPCKKRKSKKDSFNHSIKNLSMKNYSMRKLLEGKENLQGNLGLSIFDMSCEGQDSDLSDIVDQIVSRPQKVTTAKVNSNFVRLIFESKQMKTIINQRFNRNCSTPKSSPAKSFRDMKCSRSISKANTSHFFDKLTDERDAFEISIEYKHKSVVILDCDSTLDYSLPDVCL